MKKTQYLQKVLLGKLDSYLSKNEIITFSKSYKKYIFTKWTNY